VRVQVLTVVKLDQLDLLVFAQSGKFFELLSEQVQTETHWSVLVIVVELVHVFFCKFLGALLHPLAGLGGGVTVLGVVMLMVIFCVFVLVTYMELIEIINEMAALPLSFEFSSF
jgi:hypothetical protein